jgi:hypothetical protein
MSEKSKKYDEQFIEPKKEEEVVEIQAKQTKEKIENEKELDDKEEKPKKKKRKKTNDRRKKS